MTRNSEISVEGKKPEPIVVAYKVAVSLVLLVVFSFLITERRIQVNSVVIALLEIAVLVGVSIACKKIRINFRVIVFTSVALFIIQTYCICNYYIFLGWDVSVVRNTAFGIAEGKTVGEVRQYNEWYYSWYPNNLFITQLLSFSIKLSDIIGQKKNAYYVILGILSFNCQLSGVLVYYCVEKITEKKPVALFSFCLYQIFVASSPWFCVPYSDSIGISFPLIVLTLCLSIKSQTINVHRKSFFIAFISYIGYKIKPQTIFASLAIIVWFCFKQGIHTISHSKKARKIVCSSGIGLVCAVVLSAVLIRSVPGEIDHNWRMGFPHYLMMGLNEKTNGTYSEEDLFFSRSYPSSLKRDAADILEWMKRAKTLGIDGIAKLLYNKTVINFGDGSFWWGYGDGFHERIPVNDNKVANLFRNIYCSNEMGYGSYHSEWMDCMNALWIVILLFSLFIPGRKKSNRILLLVIPLFLSGVFQTVFEAGARYLFLYSPFYTMVASIGLTTVLETIEIKKSDFGELINEN